jgi:hypothetical protein
LTALVVILCMVDNKSSGYVRARKTLPLEHLWPTSAFPILKGYRHLSLAAIRPEKVRPGLDMDIEIWSYWTRPENPSICVCCTACSRPGEDMNRLIRTGARGSTEWIGAKGWEATAEECYLMASSGRDPDFTVGPGIEALPASRSSGSRFRPTSGRSQACPGRASRAARVCISSPLTCTYAATLSSTGRSGLDKGRPPVRAGTPRADA